MQENHIGEEKQNRLESFVYPYLSIFKKRWAIKNRNVYFETTALIC
jgi:hypothetical protein